MLPSDSKKALAANLRRYSGGTDTQAFRAKLETRSGVAARTIGNMMSDNEISPTLANIDRIAKALGCTAADLLTDKASLPKPTAARGQVSAEPDEMYGLSPRTLQLISRLARLERDAQSPPALLNLIESALDLIEPTASGYKVSVDPE